jgi:hypothetical protein
MIELKIANWRSLYLGVATCLIFFNPFHLNNEVYPYWILLLPLLFQSITAFIFSIVILSLGFVNYLFYSDSRAVIDSLSLVCLFIGVYSYSLLNNEEKRNLCDVFVTFIFLTFMVMLVQKYNPQFHDLILEIFSSRNALSSFYKDRNGAVTGFSPEPAYGASLIVGLMLVLFLNHRLTKSIYLLIILEIYLFRSITGTIYFIYTSLLMLSSDYKIYIKYKYYLLTFLVFSFIFFTKDLLIFINRPYEFIKLLFSSGSLVSAEENFGSQRIVNVLSSFKFFISDYITGYSPFAVFSYLGHSFLIPLIFLLAYIVMDKNSKYLILSLPFLIFGGPVMVWPLQSLLVEKKKK